ncbi:GRIP and coiled-coil domain-containing protein 1 [Amphibalanus amphitrite]|uniref:alkaline phosphatase n=1 Tax=Amphibalanus amphitrite TaxID=1232801 RepID=A0A6A4WFL3_AMPAM|nr:GRIP and coiled-coil domain-containing protein 1 [Amphibalanus amphitrite]
MRESQEVLCRERELARQTELRAADLEAELNQRHAADTRTLEMTENADRWQSRVAELEQTLCDREERTSSLESHIAEVSASLGRYQQQSVADQASIDRLKTWPPRCSQLASWLKETPQERPELLLAPLKELLSDGDDTDWRQEYRHLKEEFEKYKVRVMAARKKDPGQATCPSVTTELDTLRKQNEELRLRLRKTCEERDDLERTLRSQVSRLEQSEADLRMAHRSQLASLETQQRLRLAELEQQLAGQRLRTSALLEERDAELRQLREAASGAQPDTAAVSASLSQLGLERHEGQMLHYMQEVARKDKEISNLRRTKHQLESTMRQLQNKMLEREEVLQDEAETLREKIRRHTDTMKLLVVAACVTAVTVAVPLDSRVEDQDELEMHEMNAPTYQEVQQKMGLGDGASLSRSGKVLDSVFWKEIAQDILRTKLADPVYDHPGQERRALHRRRRFLRYGVEAGKWVGLVSTARITHASPAATFGHTAYRTWESDADFVAMEWMTGPVKDSCKNVMKDLSTQFVEREGIDINVAFGGGWGKFTPKEVEGGSRLDGRDLIQEWKDKQASLGRSYAYLTTKGRAEQL